MTKSVGVHEAKTHLSRLLELVAQGQRVEITRRGTVVAQLVPPAEPTRPHWGYAAGTVTIGDDFDAPLPDDMLADIT